MNLREADGTALDASFSRQLDRNEEFRQKTRRVAVEDHFYLRNYPRYR